MATKSQTRTANLLRLSFDQVHGVMYQSVARGLKWRSAIKMYPHLSIDEKSIHKNHDYVSILTDQDTGMVIEVESGRTDDSVDNLCTKGLNETQRANVMTVCTDMWNPFIKGVKKHFSHAQICHDNYHLVSYLNKAVDKVRKREVKQHNELRRSKYLFLKDQMSLTDKQKDKFESIAKSNYEVSRAWRVKENFRDIQFKQERVEASTLFNEWMMDARRSKIPEIIDICDMFDRHRYGIINAIQTGANNGRAERMNGSIQELKTIGRGYKDAEHFRIAILFFHGGLRLC